MHLDYRCCIVFRDEMKWRPALEQLAIEGADGEEYTLLEIGALFANSMRLMSALCDHDAKADIFDTVQSSEREKYYFIHDHKKSPRYFSDLTAYIFEELAGIVPQDFVLIADAADFDDDSTGTHIWYYSGGEELSEVDMEDWDLHDKPVLDLFEDLRVAGHLSQAQQTYLKPFV